VTTSGGRGRRGTAIRHPTGLPPQNQKIEVKASQLILVFFGIERSEGRKVERRRRGRSDGCVRVIVSLPRVGEIGFGVSLLEVDVVY